MLPQPAKLLPRKERLRQRRRREIILPGKERQNQCLVEQDGGPGAEAEIGWKKIVLVYANGFVVGFFLISSAPT